MCDILHKIAVIPHSRVLSRGRSEETSTFLLLAVRAVPLCILLSYGRIFHKLRLFDIFNPHFKLLGLFSSAPIVKGS